MGTSRRTGRPIKQSHSALGNAVAARMEAAGLSAGELANRLGVSRVTLWRVMQGKCGFSNRIGADDLCRALDLMGADRAAFLCACTPHSWPLGSGIGAAGDQVEKTRSGKGIRLHDPESAATQDLASFILTRARAAGYTLTQFARLIGIAPSTLSRLLSGKIAATHALDEAAIVRSLHLSEVDRRTFLELAAQAGVFALVTRRAPAQLRFVSIERSLGISLDSVEQQVVQMRERRNSGEALAVHQESGRLFAQLFDLSLPLTTMLKSPELARAKLHVGFEHCEAQASALPWYERAPHIVNTLNRMQEEVLLHFPPDAFVSEYGHLINLRAPLYREKSSRSELPDAYDRSIREFTWALERLVRTREEPSLTVEMLRNRAHVALLNGDKVRWRADLAAAGHVADAVRPGEREMYRALVTYSWGEGFKRLADSPESSTQQRARYLREALDALGEGQQVFEQYPYWEGYALLASIAQAQCLIWIDAEEAARRAEQLRLVALAIYPSLTQKIARMVDRAREKLRAARW